MSMKSAAVIVIGNEILDCHQLCKFLIKDLIDLQYTIKKISLVQDDEKVLCAEIKSTVQQSDVLLIIRSAGNDSIYRAMGRLFGVDVLPNTEFAEILQNLGETYTTDDISIPTTAKVIFEEKNCYPIVSLQRVFVLKGECFELSFSLLRSHLKQYNQDHVYRKIIKIPRNGNSNITFRDIEKWTNDCVKVEFDKEEHFLVFKVASLCFFHVVQFEDKIREIFQAYNFDVVEDSIYWETIYSSDDPLVKNTIDNIQKCFHQYNPENVFVCFNGGKDCTVLLHLTLVVMRKCYPKYKGAIFCLYVQSQNPFPEQDEFISLCRRYFNLEVMKIRSGIRDALEEVLIKFPNYKACLMGTRRTDPFSNSLNTFQMTDPDWPQIMRVSPILDWHYSDIWDYLLYYKVPYCKLYDLGFTSLGNTENTVKNPSLIYYDEYESEERYLPAYKLLKEAKERNGRNS